MGLKVTNNAFGTLNAGINSSATTIVLTAGQGARFPTLSAGDYFYATLIDTSNNLEIVKVTARSTDTMTVVRGQDSTTARSYSTNDRFELRPTAALFNDILDSVGPAGVSDKSNASTGYFDLPAGSTAQRPGSPNTANLRYNTDLGVMEFYNGSAWQAMDVYGAGTYPVKYAIIAGGGGGGKGSTSYAAGGGGAGGMLEGVFFATVGTVYTVTVGAGGSGSSSNIGYAGGGNNSSISGSGLTTLTAFGGGRGSNTNATGDVWGTGAIQAGCGGGGGSGNNWSNITGWAFIGGPGTVNQGCAGGGGMVYSGATFNGGGGGGGTGRPGDMGNTGNGPVGNPGTGGSGRANIVNGTVYGGGGGGGYGDYQTGDMANGGSGGGGRGGNAGTAAAAGTTNSGGGGGGGGIGSYQNGAAGGSGRVLISMPTLRYTGTTTGSPAVSTSGSDTILNFTSSGSFTA